MLAIVSYWSRSRRLTGYSIGMSRRQTGDDTGPKKSLTLENTTSK
jgi:hypothetical protein